MKNEIQLYDNNLPAEIKKAAWNALSIESQKAYKSDYDLFFQFVNKDPKKVTASDVILFIEHLEANNYKNASINRKIASLSKMFKIMMLAGEIKVNPIEALKQLKNINFKTSKEVKISLTLDDIKKATKINKKNSEYENRLSIIIKMLAKTGLRISEMIHIKKDDISEHNKDTKLIRIKGKGKKERSIFVDVEFMSEIKKYFPVNKDSEYIFYTVHNKPFDRIMLYKHIRKRFLRETEKCTHPHDLRHWYITQKIVYEKQDIKSVSLYAGHSSSSITLDMYVDSSLDAKKAKIKI